ncbi:Aste57867_13862 [Aphanomyces stellatus]|uniref:Aste57867_13862 protein n=1 Tax=Aphanomyces stellatus TaxID=120398 RepID=A0A485L047_9STRA|nr:hypothetical protein As57867_013811 [Aphanomyces stellatus]VFT90693.1 Aste57867_13862 [Aphanomyces stellatus]
MNRILATPANLAFELNYVAKTFAPLAPWAAPGAVVVGWLAWPALTPAYKNETFGVPLPVAPGTEPVVVGSAGTGFRQVKYVKGEIGERPTIEED